MGRFITGIIISFAVCVIFDCSLSKIFKCSLTDDKITRLSSIRTIITILILFLYFYISNNFFGI